MNNGDTVFVTMTAVHYGEPQAFVSEAVVLDGAHNLVQLGGSVRVLHGFESAYATEREAWEQAARELSAAAETVRQKAQECLQRAAAAGIVQVPA